MFELLNLQQALRRRMTGNEHYQQYDQHTLHHFCATQLDTGLPCL